MASTAPTSPQTSTVKHFTESHILTSIPNHYKLPAQLDHNIISSGTIPTVDISLLTSRSTVQRSQAVRELGEACRDWGFFQVVNHGVPEKLREEVIKVCEEFFELPEEEKKKMGGKHVLDPIRCGTSFNTAVDKMYYWRDFLKVFVYPDFYSPTQPTNFRFKSNPVLDIIIVLFMVKRFFLCHGSPTKVHLFAREKDLGNLHHLGMMLSIQNPINNAYNLYGVE